MLDQALTLRKVRRTKTILLVVIAIAMVVLILVSMVHKGMTASPLFLPFPAILYTVLMAGMLMTIVSIVFNGVEIATADTPGQRFLSAQHGYRVSRVTGALVLILVIVFVLLIPLVETYISTEENDTIDASIIRTHDFFTVDDFDTTYVEELSLEALSGAPVLYTIKAKDPTTARYREKETGQVMDGDVLNMNLKEWPRGDYRIEIYIDGTPTDDTAEFTYRLERFLNPEISVSLTGFLGVIAVASLVWTVIAYLLMRRYEVESVGGLATVLPTEGEF
jgi:hypothetical protein